MNIKQIKNKKWDYIIVGTGMGGGPLGLKLAQAGFSVLFIEKGLSPKSRFALKGDFAETFSLENTNAAERLARGGRFNEVIYDVTKKKAKILRPFLGSGVGGSSALYGMVLERFNPSDFNGWPLSYSEFQRHYLDAESLFRVRKHRRSINPGYIELNQHLVEAGTKPYVLPIANEANPECNDCQSKLCSSGCKNDSGKICIEPAVKMYGAELLINCEVQKINTNQSVATAVEVSIDDETVVIQAKNIILSAGALKSPLLLLKSKSKDFPQGLGNQSSLVGRNLMRHLVDLYALKIDTDPENKSVKEIAFQEFINGDEPTIASVQSFGRLPPVQFLVDQIHTQVKEQKNPALYFLFSLFKPMLKLVISKLSARRLVMVSIIADNPNPANRVWSENGKTFISYEISGNDQKNLNQLRARLKKLFKPLNLWFIAVSEKNAMLAHVCGTCKMGVDPSESVVDKDNRVHGLENLYVVDSSFFPSSGGTNPALTIAANSLRVAEILIEHEKTNQQKIKSSDWTDSHES